MTQKFTEQIPAAFLLLQLISKILMIRPPLFYFFPFRASFQVIIKRMEQLTEMLLNIDYMMTFTFEEFIEIIGNIYEHNPEKRITISYMLGELSTLDRIRRTDVMSRAVHVLEISPALQHVQLFWDFEDMEELYSTIITDPSLPVTHFFCDLLTRAAIRDHFCPNSY